MSFLRRFDLCESIGCDSRPSFLFPSSPGMELDAQLKFTLDILCPSASPKSALIDSPSIHSHSFDVLAADLALISFQPFAAAVRRAEAEIQMQSLCSRVAALEFAFNRVLDSTNQESDRKFKWSADLNGPKGEESHRKYKVVAKAKAGGERSLKWTSNVKGKGSYTFETSTAPAATAYAKKNEKDDKGLKKKEKETAKLVEIEDNDSLGMMIMRKAFTKRDHVDGKGKRKEISPRDAAVIIQTSFRAYLIRRSQVLRGLRDLAVAKAKLKEIRSLFNSLSYRQRINRDTEERQRYTEKIIVLLLTVEAIQGSDYMIRAAKKSIIEELEIKLEVVDPQPERLCSLRRRKFDLPESTSISRDIAKSVAQVVELIDEHGDGSA